MAVFIANLQLFTLRFAQTIGTGTCDKAKTFFGMKPWYYYANFSTSPDTPCAYQAVNGSSLTGADIWPIAAVAFEDLLIIATYVSIAFVLVGAFQMITAQGEPEKFKNARGTIINALIGLVIALLGAQLVGYLFNGIFAP